MGRWMGRGGLGCQVKTVKSPFGYRQEINLCCLFRIRSPEEKAEV